MAENTLESHDHDKSDSMAKSILEVIRRACLDPDGDLDQESFAMIQSKIQHFASDPRPFGHEVWQDHAINHANHLVGLP